MFYSTSTCLEQPVESRCYRNITLRNICHKDTTITRSNIHRPKKISKIKYYFKWQKLKSASIIESHAFIHIHKKSKSKSKSSSIVISSIGDYHKATFFKKKKKY